MTELPEGWRTATLDEVAEDINNRVDNPSESGYERFVGLEHFESGELTIKKWGSTLDVESSMKVFQKGDLLFARRNAYLKRASMVDFDGLCSGDAFVLRQKPDVLVENYLPLIFNTEALWDYAISHAAGSMSKRVKWRDLKEYEFPLPPLSEQKRIAEVLWAVEDSIRKTEDAIEIVERYKKVLMKHLFTYGPVSNKETGNIHLLDSKIGKFPPSWQLIKVGDLVEKIKQYDPTRYPDEYFTYIDVSSVSNETFDIVETSDIIGKEAPSRARQRVRENDVLMATVRPNLKRIAMVPARYDRQICSTGFFVLRAKEGVSLPHYLFHLVSYEGFVRRLIAFQTGTAYPAVSDTNARKIKVPIPPLDEQRKISNMLTNIDECISGYRETISHLQVVKTNLLNEILYGIRRLGGKSNV